ncbi:MAG: hypothetical protein JWR09_5660 [Mucilaginibacter sp.]|nr:hypothetical protein [Mucilaginibacter sp.]
MKTTLKLLFFLIPMVSFVPPSFSKKTLHERYHTGICTQTVNGVTTTTAECYTPDPKGECVYASECSGIGN